MELADRSSIIWLILTAVNIIFSVIGFRNRRFFEKYLFSVDGILREREYLRIITSGFLHGSWMHLFFNIYSFYWFGTALERYLSPAEFLAVYFGSLIGGNLTSLYMHRYHGDYRAIGASGAVSGVIFSFVLIEPSASLSFMFIPFPIPAWLFGIIYVLISIFGIKAKSDNIGHEAHLGGAMAGIIISLLFNRTLLTDSGWLAILLLGGFGLFLWLYSNTKIFTTPDVSQSIFRPQRSGKQSARIVDNRLREEMNELLDKTHERGWDNLSEYEQRRLHYLVERLRG